MEEKRKKIKPGRSNKLDTCEYIRNKQIHIRASEDEYAEIEILAKQHRKSIAKFLRDKALSKHQEKKYKNAEEMHLTVALLNQIQKLGSNVNQIAYRLNTKASSTNEIDEFREALQELKRIIRKG